MTASERPAMSRPAARAVADPNAILDGISELFIATDREWRVTYVNRRARQYLHILGTNADALIGEVLWDALPFLQGTAFHTAALRALARETEIETEAQLAPLDRWFVSRIAPTSDGVVSYSRDVTARHLAEHAARTNAAQLQQLNDTLAQRVAELRALLDLIPVGIGVALDPEAREIRMNPVFAAMLGVDPATNPSLTGPNAPRMHYRILRNGREVAPFDLPIQRAARGGTIAGEEIDVVRPDGGHSVLLCHASPLFDSAGKPRGSVAAFLDITQRQREERAQRLLSEAGGLLNSTLDLETTLSAMAQMAVPAFADACFVDLFEEGRLERVDLACADPADRERLLPLALHHAPALPGEDHAVARAVRTGEPVLAQVTEESRRRVARSEEHLQFLQMVGAQSLISAPLVARGEVLGAITFCFVQSGRRYDEADVEVARELAARAAFAVVNARLYRAARSELARRARAEADVARWGNIFRHAGWGVAIGAPDASTFETVNPAYARMHGYDEPEDLIGRPIDTVTAPACRELIDRNRDLARQRGRVVFETRHITRDGTEFPVQVDLVAVRAEDGTLRCFAANVQDLTERERAEAQVRQAQKMEALGRLAGGVAHDFNNVLMVIIGFADFLTSSMEQADPRRTDAEEIRKAAERAAALTRQLLAFGRPRQSEPQAVDLNRVVRDMELMLRSVLGEQIRLEHHLLPGHIAVEAEQGQLEQVIMNLALNARDAMPDGGRLEIRTDAVTFYGDEALRATGINLPPGDYHTLTVADTGHGMDTATRARIFEPFFTTRRSAQNSGLGLAVVYGIVTQNRGHVWVDSELGQGTQFTICFPRVSQQVDTPQEELRAMVRGGSERILIVEDEETVRTLTARVLADAGYAVTSARDGREALDILHREQIDLVLTDVVMPAMSGGDLAARIAVEWPDLPVLFMSGYTGADLAGLTGSDDRFLQKPFSGESLLQKARRILDAGHRSHTGRTHASILGSPEPLSDREQ